MKQGESAKPQRNLLSCCAPGVCSQPITLRFVPSKKFPNYTWFLDLLSLTGGIDPIVLPVSKSRLFFLAKVGIASFFTRPVGGYSFVSGCLFSLRLSHSHVTPSLLLLLSSVISFSYQLLSPSPAPSQRKTTISSWPSEGFLLSDFAFESASYFECKFVLFNSNFLIFGRRNFFYRFCIVAISSNVGSITLETLFLFLFSSEETIEDRWLLVVFDFFGE
jgi:hypothetical protein